VCQEKGLDKARKCPHQEELNWEEIYEAIDDFVLQNPQQSEYDALFFLLKICPVGLPVEDELFWLDLEAHCSQYHCLPYPGGLLDQPARIMDAFAIIRSVRNRYEQEKIKKIK